MVDDLAAPLLTSYSDALSDYIRTRSEASLYRASLLGRAGVEGGLGPDELIALHAEALEHAVGGLSYRQVAGAGVDALQFLLEVMIAYGLTYREYLELKVRERDSAMATADKERAELLATVAHVMRTPLTAALGTIDLARRAPGVQRSPEAPRRGGLGGRGLDRVLRAGGLAHGDVRALVGGDTGEDVAHAETSLRLMATSLSSAARARPSSMT